MNKTRMKLIFAVVLLAMLVPAVSIGARVDLDKLRSERQILQQNIRNTRAEIAANQRDLNQAEREIQQLDDRIMEVLENMAILSEDLAIIEDRYEQALIELDEARAYRDAQERTVHDRLRALHEYGQPSLLDVFVQATNIWDFVMRVEALDRIAKQDQEMLQKLEEAEIRYLASVEDEARLFNTLESLMASLERTHIELDHLLMQWEEEHERLLGDRITYEQMMAAFQAQERTVAQQIAEEERRIAAEAEAARQREWAQAVLNLNGDFRWPVPGIAYVSSEYGMRPNPFNRRVQQMHNGIDIAGPTGTPIIAVANGVVARSVTGWNGGYGNMVIIDHGGGVTTLYAHNSRNNVTEGQRVYVTDVIAYMGSTGSSTGPHLHFEVRINNRPVDPNPFLGRTVRR